MQGRGRHTRHACRGCRSEIRGEVAYGTEFFRWFSEEAVRISGDHTTTGDGATRIVVGRAPVGPRVLVTPWNFPLAMATRKIGPAIAAGWTRRIPTVMRTSMELGGNAPFNVCADADLDRAVEGALGQLKVGDGMDAGIDVGPMIDAAGLEKVQRLVDDAVSRGAGILTGGQPADLPGYFYHPTVLSDVPSDAALMNPGHRRGLQARRGAWGGNGGPKQRYRLQPRSTVRRHQALRNRPRRRQTRN